MPKKEQPKPDGYPSNTVQVSGEPAARPRLIAQLAVTPSLQGASTIKRWSHAVGDLDINSLIDELRQQAATASGADLKRQEATLAIQAHTLDTLFNELARRANAAEYLPQFETYLKLGLKAQSQCRATIETLAEMKNPKPVAFVQQANIATGPQQVNNIRRTLTEASRAGNPEIEQSKLLEAQDGERLDSGATSEAIDCDPAVAAVGAVHRAKIA
jgi:hypothetical protein